MKNQEKINELLQEFLKSYPVTNLEKQLFNVQGALLFSTDFEDWAPGARYVVFMLFRRIVKLFEELEELTKNE